MPVKFIAIFESVKERGFNKEGYHLSVLKI